MVINYFYVKNVGTLHGKTNAILLVDADTELSFSFTFQVLQVVGRWYS